MTVNEIGIVADQKQRGFRLVIRRAQTAGEIFKGATTGHVVVETHCRAGTGRLEAVDADLVRRELDREGARHVDDAGLGRSIGDAVETPDHARGRTKIYDLSTAPLLAHLLRDILGDEVRAFEA